MHIDMGMILLNKEQASQIRGTYGKYSELQPIPVVEGFALPIDILNDQEFESVRDFLTSLPIQEINFIQPAEIIEEYI
jgi:hypothetical protein